VLIDRLHVKGIRWLFSFFSISGTIMIKTKIAKAVGIAVAGCALGLASGAANANQATFYAPNTTYSTAATGSSAASTVGNIFANGNSYSLSDSDGVYTWSGANTLAGFGAAGIGWGHTTHWLTFTLTSATALDIVMQATGTNSVFAPAFSLYSTAGYNNPGAVAGGVGGHSYDQVRATSVNGWLTAANEGGVTGFVGYANSGLTGWTNGFGDQIGTGSGGTVTVSNGYAELTTGVLGPGQYLLAMGSAAGQLTNTGSITTLASSGTGTTTFNLSVTAVPVPGAVWLFGSALMGFIGMGRRKAA
jgi:hypothetical protein